MKSKQGKQNKANTKKKQNTYLHTLTYITSQNVQRHHTPQNLNRIAHGLRPRTCLRYVGFAPVGSGMADSWKYALGSTSAKSQEDNTGPGRGNPILHL